MKIQMEPDIRLTAAPAIDAFLHNFAQVASAFEYDWRDQASFVRRATHLVANWQGDRGALAGALERYNQAIGADEAALANVRRLREDQTLTVVTGQQAGIFTGPAYSIYKAITAIRLAREQSDRLGVPVVPVFWIAGEDHDFAEVNAVWAPTNAGLTKMQVDHEPPTRRSVGYIPLPSTLPDAIDALLEQLPETEFKPLVAAKLREAAEGAGALALPEGDDPAAPTYADWFARLMAWFFAGTGLLFVNSADPALRQLERDFFLQAIESADRVDAAFAAGLARWESLGFAPTVERQEGHLNLFTYVNGERLPLIGDGQAWCVRDRESLRWTKAELLERARRSPELFSTNVVLRPVVQGALFPDLAYVGGPGEINYFGLYRDVFGALGRQMPVIYPRFSATLVEPALARYLEKQGLTLPDVCYRLAEKRQELLEREDRLGLAALFDEFRTGFDARYATLVEAVLSLDGSLSYVAEENRKQIRAQINRLEDKARQQHRKNCEVALRQFERLGAHLYPGGLQERVVSIIPYLVKYGPDLVTKLVDAFEVTENGWVHRSVWL